MADKAGVQNEPDATVFRANGALLAIPRGYDAADSIATEAGQIVSYVNGPGSEIRDEALPGHLRERFADRMARAGRASLNAMASHQREYLEREARLREPAGSIDGAHDAERRARFRDMEPGAMMAAIQHAGLADLAALAAHGNIAGLPSQAFAEAEKRYLIENVIEATGLQAGFALTPTYAEPLPAGVDVAAARRQAAGILDSHEADRQMVEIHAVILRDYASFAGHLFGMEPDAAFDLIVRG